MNCTVFHNCDHYHNNKAQYRSHLREDLSITKLPMELN